MKVLSADGTLRYMNERGLVLMGASSEEQVRNRNYVEFWPPERRQEVSDAIRRAAAGHRTRVEGYCPTLDGRPRWWEAHFEPVQSSDRRGADVVGISRDISDRREHELASRANEERLNNLLESTREGISGIDREGRCTFLNSAGARMLGYSPEELIGTFLDPMIHHHTVDGRMLPSHESKIFKATLTGVTARVDNEVFWHKEGYAVPVSYSVFPILDDATPTGAVITFSDNTERKRVETDLRHLASALSEADRRKTEFIATLAHELRNPLAPLKTGLNLIGLAGDDPQSVQKLRLMMERQLSQMVYLINELLDIARITSGKIDLTKERLSFARVIAASVETSGPLIKAKEHTLSLDVPTETLTVDGDFTRLAQIFTNLINNAAQYTPRRGTISLRVRRTRDDVEIAVKDNGIGIAPEALPAIFEMFSRSSSTEKELRGGLGIGLNLVRRLCELHGGSVTAASAGVGAGSTFTVRLPLASTLGESEDAAPDPPRLEATTQTLRILVVDDNIDAADTLAMLLDTESHSVRVVHGGIEALLAAAEMQPDIVFLDIGMPGMNGFEVARALRKLPDIPSPFLVALTGWGGKDDVSRAHEAGFDEHLTKPADLMSIDEMIAKARRNHRMHPSPRSGGETEPSQSV